MMRKTKEKVYGAKKDGDFYYCNKCGANISEEGSVKSYGHFDGLDCYGYMFACEKCGNSIRLELPRSREDMW